MSWHLHRDTHTKIDKELYTTLGHTPQLKAGVMCAASGRELPSSAWGWQSSTLTSRPQHVHTPLSHMSCDGCPISSEFYRGFQLPGDKREGESWDGTHRQAAHHFLTVTKKLSRHHFIGVPSKCVLEEEGEGEGEGERRRQNIGTCVLDFI